MKQTIQLLSDRAPELARIVKRSAILTPPQFTASEISCKTLMVSVRDGTRLATDIYRPPVTSAPSIIVRTPYGTALDAYSGVFISLARRGYVVVSQDCRGTGDSEPDSWDYYMYEPEDSYNLVEWLTQQAWFDGFIGACGGSYTGRMQWQMAMHPHMSAIVPDVSGLGVAVNTMRLHMFVNAYARSHGAIHPSADGLSYLPSTFRTDDRTRTTAFHPHFFSWRSICIGRSPFAC
jgi:uncharacterized protein